MLTDMSDANSIFIASSAAALSPVVFSGRQCIGLVLRHSAALGAMVAKRSPRRTSFSRFPSFITTELYKRSEIAAT
jgi:hypothetical protein